MVENKAIQASDNIFNAYLILNNIQDMNVYDYRHIKKNLRKLEKAIDNIRVKSN